MSDKFSFKLGEMYEGSFGYDTIYHAELTHDDAYTVSWEEDGEPNSTVYSVVSAEDAIEEGYWVLID